MNLSDLAKLHPVKLLNMGFPGCGKTSALAALANAGYKLRILSYDGNIDPLFAYVAREHWDNVEVVVLQDRLRSGPKGAIPSGLPQAFKKGLDLLDHWKVDGKDLGKPVDWGLDIVIVLDPITQQGLSAMRAAVSMANRTAKGPRLKDWGTAISMQESMVEYLCTSNVGCNVVVNAHLKWVGPDDIIDNDDELAKKKMEKKLATFDYRLLPTALGKTLPQSFSGHFSTAVQTVRQVLPGGRVKRVILTEPEIDLDVKMPALDIPKELPISTGLATIFEAVMKNRVKEK